MRRRPPLCPPGYPHQWEIPPLWKIPKEKISPSGLFNDDLPKSSTFPGAKTSIDPAGNAWASSTGPSRPLPAGRAGCLHGTAWCLGKSDRLRSLLQHRGLLAELLSVHTGVTEIQTWLSPGKSLEAQGCTACPKTSAWEQTQGKHKEFPELQ